MFLTKLAGVAGKPKTTVKNKFTGDSVTIKAVAVVLGAEALGALAEGAGVSAKAAKVESDTLTVSRSVSVPAGTDARAVTLALFGIDVETDGERAEREAAELAENARSAKPRKSRGGKADAVEPATNGHKSEPVS